MVEVVSDDLLQLVVRRRFLEALAQIEFQVLVQLISCHCGHKRGGETDGHGIKTNPADNNTERHGGQPDGSNVRIGAFRRLPVHVTVTVRNACERQTSGLTTRTIERDSSDGARRDASRKYKVGALKSNIAFRSNKLSSWHRCRGRLWFFPGERLVREGPGFCFHGNRIRACVLNNVMDIASVCVCV